jgi:hypothetical protein
MNIIILFAAGALAYFTTRLFDIIDGYIAKYQLIKAREKRFQNEIYKKKLKIIYKYAQCLFIEQGFSREEAQNRALEYIIEVDKNSYTEYKYQLIKSKGVCCGIARNKRSGI